MQLRVKSVVYEAEDILSLELRSPDGSILPAFTAGAHIELHLANGLRRQYSLANPQTERHRYRIGVLKDASGRGGSKFVHESVRPGDILTVEEPRNNFPLTEDAAHTVLIAGGIGITPVWCMAQRLRELGRPWALHYAVRTQARAAFLDDMEPGWFRLHCDDAYDGRPLDIAAIVANAPPHTHFYCCGPLPMLAAFEQATAALPLEQIHTEYFQAREPLATAGGFDVVLARGNRTIHVPENGTILDALLAAGVDAGHSCLEGVCGTCETKVIEGIPDHRDTVLTAAERASNRTMMICCSGSKSSRLVLDL